MTDTPEIARIRAVLAEGPIPRSWTTKETQEHWGRGQITGIVVSGTGSGVAQVWQGNSRENRANAEYIAACNPSTMTAVLAHLDAQAAEIERLRAIIADCRDAAPTPAPLSEADSELHAAMSFAEGVPGFLKASFNAQDREIERLRQYNATRTDELAASVHQCGKQAALIERLRAAIKSAYEEGFYAPTTYNDSPTNDVEETWSESQAAIDAAMKEPK